MQLPAGLHPTAMNGLSYAQLQVSSMSLPLRSIEDRKSVASSSDMLPTLTAAFLMAAFTAMGILFEDLANHPS